MEIDEKIGIRSNAALEECSPDELIVRVLKLRWIGMDNEADRLETVLRRMHPRWTLLGGPFDTD